MLNVGIRMVSVVKDHRTPFNIAVCTCLKPVFSRFCCCISLACVFSLIDDWLQISKFGESRFIFCRCTSWNSTDFKKKLMSSKMKTFSLLLFLLPQELCLLWRLNVGINACISISILAKKILRQSIIYKLKTVCVAVVKNTKSRHHLTI